MNNESTNKIIKKNDPLAVISLVLASGVFFLGILIPLAAIPAIICARISLKRIHDNNDLKGDSYAIAGMITGYVSLFCYLIIILISMRIFGHTTSFTNPMITLPK